MNTDVLIVGAGLSGLRTAHLLSQTQRRVTLLDSRSRLGGRILSADFDVQFQPEHHLDMGPSWFWPWQRRMQSLIDELNIRSLVYEQFSQGLSVAEYRNGKLEHQHGLASMAGSQRLEGGMTTLIDRLHQQTLNDSPTFSVSTDTIVHKVSNGAQGLAVDIQKNGQRETLTANQIVFAAPPRIVLSHVVFEPALPEQQQNLMSATPTWMAGQAKFVALYDAPFWRDKGLSGDAVSEIGPMGEIHDASSSLGSTHALFGFLGVPYQTRIQHAAEMTKLCTEQFSRIFGDGSEKPLASCFKDWAADEFTSTAPDQTGRGGHAHQVINTDPYWENRLFWAGSETASVSAGENGYLEGALASAERVTKQILKM